MNATELFDELRAQGMERITSLVSNRVFEGLQLDYKVVPELDKFSPKVYAEIAGAFANTDGGVIVWGVKCQGKGDQCKFEMWEVSNPHALMDRLRDFELHLTDPPIVGIEHIVIEEGFVCTFVPKSIRAPHKSLAGNFKYFIRFGDKCGDMPHRFIESLILSKRVPYFTLEIDTRFFYRGFNDSKTHYSIRIRARNASSVTAKSPIIAATSECEITLESQFLTTADYSMDGIPGRTSSRRMCSENSLHPGGSYSASLSRNGNPANEDTTIWFRILSEDHFQIFGVTLLGTQEVSSDLRSPQYVRVEDCSPEDVNLLFSESVLPSPNQLNVIVVQRPQLR